LVYLHYLSYLLDTEVIVRAHQPHLYSYSRTTITLIFMSLL